jgi:hypothetical protein
MGHEAAAIPSPVVGRANDLGRLSRRKQRESAANDEWPERRLRWCIERHRQPRSHGQCPHQLLVRWTLQMSLQRIRVRVRFVQKDAICIVSIFDHIETESRWLSRDRCTPVFYKRLDEILTMFGLYLKATDSSKHSVLSNGP